MDTNIVQQPVPQTPPTSPSQTPAVSYAGFWSRVLAVIIDSILIGIVSAGVGAIVGYHPGAWGPGNNESNGISGLLGLMYYTLMESSEYQATLGKILVGIKVTDLAGNRISWPKAVGRYLAKIISGIILMIGFIMAAFTEKKQGLHDIIAGTLVIKK